MSFIFNIFSRFQQIESRWGYSGTSDKIRFIVDRRIFVVGFGLYGSIHGPSEYDVTIQLLHTGSGRQLGSNEISFSSDGTNSTFRAMFKESTLYCLENKITLTRNLVIALKFKKEKKTSTLHNTNTKCVLYCPGSCRDTAQHQLYSCCNPQGS